MFFISTYANEGFIGINLRWDYFVNTYDAHHRPLSYLTGTPLDARENRHVMFVREFANVVSVFQDKVDALIGYYDDINKSIEEMKACPYQIDRFEDALGRIQKLVRCIIKLALIFD